MILSGSSGVQLPLVDDVVQPPADQRRDGDDDDAVAGDVLVLAGAPGEPDQQQVGGRQPDRVAQAVPADAERADGEGDGIGRGVEHRAECTGRGAVRPGDRSLYFAAVNAEFNWWLLIVGLVVGAGLVWFVVLDSRRREVDIDDGERPREAAWLSRDPGRRGLGRQPGGRGRACSSSTGATSRRRRPTSRPEVVAEPDPATDPRR